jgi:hypothetical protein
MKQKIVWIVMLVVGVLIGGSSLFAGENSEVKAKNSKSLQFSGRVQLQHAWNEAFSLIDEARTKHGYRLRRGRLQIDAKLTSFVSAKFQMEARDNSPRLKDAEGKIKLFKDFYWRFGQFKIPVWREEFKRSSGSLLLVERSVASSFLIVNLLSARQLGVEFGGKLGKKFSFAVNYNNGSGEGNSELQAQKSDDIEDNINNGKMYVGRMDYNFSNAFKVGLSGVINNVGTRQDTLNTTGNNTLIAPDIGIYLPIGLDIEAGIAFGEISKGYVAEFDDKKYTVWDVTGRWKTTFAKVENLGGIDGFEIAAGVSGVNSDASTGDKSVEYRIGPAIYFGKKMRLQANFEVIDFADPNENTNYAVRNQFTVNF